MRPVWQERSMDELVLLPEEVAVRSWQDTRNCLTLFRWMVVFTLAATIAGLVFLATEEYQKLVLPIVDLIIIRFVYASRDRSIFTLRFRPILVGFLTIQALLVRAFFFELPMGGGDVEAASALDEVVRSLYHPVDFLLPLVFLFFRMEGPLLALPLGALWAVGGGRDLVTALIGETLPDLQRLALQTVIVAAVLAVTHALTRAGTREMLDRWRLEHRRYRERLRMQEELDDARRIQLSMLPRSDPRLDWIDVAGISIPASEVGGDYWDYFKIDEGRFALVVGDVAGHGVASGLLLSGVRSCLHLLKDTPMPPREIFARLDRMVKETTGRRMFVTLFYVVFDREARTATYAAAGHPPLLCYRAGTGAVEELGFESLPLGTALGARAVDGTIPFEPDDIFVMYTDGVAETVNRRGEAFSYERLAERLRTTSHDRSAKEIRDTLLGSIWSFKADGEQTDDVTLVIAKIP